MHQRGVLRQSGRNALGSRRLDPGLEVGPGRFFPLRDGLSGSGQFLLKLPEPRPIGYQRHWQNRRRVVNVAVLGPLGGVVEEGREFIELALREWVKLMVVTDRAASGQPHEDSGRRLRAVTGVEHQVLLVDDAPFIGRHVAAVEAAGNFVVEDLVGRSVGTMVGNEVAGELQNGELVKGHVPVEGVDHPLAIGPHLAIVVEVDAMGVGIAGIVEPMPAAMFTPLEACQQGIDQPLVGVSMRVEHEGLDQCRVGGQAGKVVGNPAGQCAAVGLGSRGQPLRLQTGQHKPVDRVTNPVGLPHLRERRPRRWDERPVRLIFGPFLDPADEHFLLLCRKCLLRFRRRHHHLGVIGIDPVENGG